MDGFKVTEWDSGPLPGSIVFEVTNLRTGAVLWLTTTNGLNYTPSGTDIYSPEELSAAVTACITYTYHLAYWNGRQQP